MSFVSGPEQRSVFQKVHGNFQLFVVIEIRVVLLLVVVLAVPLVDRFKFLFMRWIIIVISSSPCFVVAMISAEWLNQLQFSFFLHQAVIWLTCVAKSNFWTLKQIQNSAFMLSYHSISLFVIFTLPLIAAQCKAWIKYYLKNTQHLQNFGTHRPSIFGINKSTRHLLLKKSNDGSCVIDGCCSI